MRGISKELCLTSTSARRNTSGFTQHLFPFRTKKWLGLVSNDKKLGSPSTTFARKSGAGFTFVEVMTVIGIMTVLVAASVPSYFTLRSNIFLSDEVQHAGETLRTAQSRSITSQGGFRHGVHFDSSVVPNTYGLFYIDDAGTSVYSSPSPLNHDLRFLSPTPADIVFAHLSGMTTAATVVVGYPSGDQKTIQIDANGKIILP
ncbi:MAG: hypothetical protein A3B30_03975 [Candidatus Komeilibacteria bacterium RIFCSPLOWO2_01_FULL_52_15]|uniref:General secretion pathway GspH domain-containing protein n=2 Tax=Candidatus Komeiliibacteriota TaxID=1817908 RepID=A0A1G2BQE5_9BACT|nr:MAG: hypothetical protein A2677_00675 [Candidatus Komeilibacteria bacterium RIFCSPHIGHO2_01_FULL_52_14]OGY91321.1 MAG: hypothetical protein A3B30_03975 [Candidatus Komeilibacteria bacterium RIFCSPLOWO2_01_FULL_52_15]